MAEPMKGPVPEWDLTDRMRKALKWGDIGVQEMADYLGVNRWTVSSWINGRVVPSKSTLRDWAKRCDVPAEWLLGDDGGLETLKSWFSVTADIEPGLAVPA